MEDVQKTSNQFLKKTTKPMLIEAMPRYWNFACLSIFLNEVCPNTSITYLSIYFRTKLQLPAIFLSLVKTVGVFVHYLKSQ